jgi:hypothetical protein
MTTKRKRKAKPMHDSLAQPTHWRLQHGDFSPPRPETDPDTGRAMSRRRADDVLDRMLANGTISAAMRDAGESFHMQFRAASLDPIRPMPLLRMPGGGGATLTERAEAARHKVHRAMSALGGQDSAAGSCVWHVVGCGMSVREWALREGWGGRSVGHVQAQGVLVAALGVLAGYFGMAQRNSA